MSLNLFKKKSFEDFENEMVNTGFGKVGRVQVRGEPNLQKVSVFRIRLKDEDPWQTFTPIKQINKIGNTVYRFSFDLSVDKCLAYNPETNEYLLYVRV